MSIPIIVPGTLQPDGLTLRLEHKLAMPPGPVTVAVKRVEARTVPTMLEALDQIHAAQQQRGRKPATDDETTAEIARTRADEAQEEARWQEIWSQTNAPSADGP
jgi:hypothetical protein